MKRNPAEASPEATPRPVAAPGLERRILARLPEIAIGGSLIAGMVSASAHFFPPEGSIAQVE
jgi:hypothetical protein